MNLSSPAAKISCNIHRKLLPYASQVYYMGNLTGLYTIFFNSLLTNAIEVYNISLKFKIFEIRNEMAADYENKSSGDRFLCTGAYSYQ